MSLFTFHVHYTIDSESFNKKLDVIIQKLNAMALTVADLTAKLDALQTVVDEEQQEISNALGALTTEVAALKEIIAAGSDQAALQAGIDKIDAIIADVKATIPNLPEPEPEV